MVVRKAVWDEKGERQLKRGSRSEVKKYFPSDQVETDEGLGQVCADCGHDIPLSDVTGQYKGKCAKCREKQRERFDDAEKRRPIEIKRDNDGHYFSRKPIGGDSRILDSGGT